MTSRARSVRGTLRRLRSSADRGAILEAAFLLPVVSLGLRALGWGRIERFLDRKSATSRRRSIEEARHLSAVVERTARRIPAQFSCLQRSMVLWRMLSRRNLEAQLRIGVRKGEADGHQFHAWVEHGGEILNDAPDVRERYSTFGSAKPIQGSRNE